LRYDILYGRKSVHAKITKEDYIRIRHKLDENGLTMQDLFNEFIYIAMEDTGRSEKIFKDATKRKMQLHIDRIVTRQNRLNLGELDADTMYDLLEAVEVKD